MTISQSRLHASVEAGRAILDAYEAKCAKAREVVQMAKRGDLPPHIILAYLDAVATPDMGIAEPRATLAAEAAHYAATAKRNARSQAYRRRESGTEVYESRQSPNPSQWTTPTPQPSVAVHQPAREAEADLALTAAMFPEVRLTEAERKEIAVLSELMGLTETARALDKIGLDPTAGLTSTYRWNPTTREVELASRTSEPTETEEDWGSE